MKWLEAVKLWNDKQKKKNKAHKWKIPRKDTPEHAAVKKLMGPSKAAKAKKAPAKAKAKPKKKTAPAKAKVAPVVELEVEEYE